MKNSTVNESKGVKLSETIKETDLNELRDRAQNAVEKYIELSESPTSSLAWHLHCLCRSGKGDDYGYKHFEIEHTQYFISNLIKFFLIGDNAARFEKEVPHTEGDLSSYLPRLEHYFSELMSKQTAAHLDAIEAGWFKSSLTTKEAEDLIFLYEREIDLLQARQEIMASHRKRA